MYRNSNNSGNTIIAVPSLADLHLMGSAGSGFTLGNYLIVYDSLSIDGGERNLNNHNLTVKKNIF